MYTLRRKWEIVNEWFKKITEQVKMQTILHAALQCEIKPQLSKLHHLPFLDSGTTVNFNILFHTSKISQVLPKTKHKQKTSNTPQQTITPKTKPNQKAKKKKPAKKTSHTISTMCNLLQCKILMNG